MPNSSRLDRGFLEACSRLWKTHRGFIEACSRLSETIGFYGAGLIETRSRLSKTIVFLVENASRLHRGLLEALRNHLFFVQQNSSRLTRGFRKLLFSLWKKHRGFIEACSRLSKTIGFNAAELIEARSSFPFGLHEPF